MDKDHCYNTRSKNNGDCCNTENNAKFTRKIIPVNHERSKNKYKVRDTPPKQVVTISNTSSNDSYRAKINLKNVNNDGNDELITLLQKLADVANGVKQLKDKSKKNKNDNDDSDDEDFVLHLDAYKEIENLNEDIEYTEEEYAYIKNLSKTKRKEFVDLENKIVDISKEETPIRFKILSSNMDIRTKANIIRKIDHFYQLDPSDNEYQKLCPWVEQLDKIPFGKYCPTNVTINNSDEEIQEYLINTKNTMDEAVYGHDVAKTQILSVVARDISNPFSGGNCIAIEGPMGNGKTTLVKEGICKAMNRPFAFIALGGMQDASYLQGHELTYEGSKCGRIIEMLVETGCMNPVIFFDELDKVSDTPKGEEITNLLCHLTDSSQNKEFHDKYFSGINFDLSRATFIFSYNNAAAINPILLDRMYKIKTKVFDKKSKTKIAQNYLLPNILKEFNFNSKDITFDTEAINNLIENFTNNEEGVRNLKRNIESVVFKLNVMRYLKPELVKLVESEISVTKKETENKAESKSEVSVTEDDTQAENKPEVSVIVDESESDECNNQIKLIIDDNCDSVNKIDSEIKLVKSKTEIPDDIVNFDIKNFKIPYNVTVSDISFFLKKESKNASFEHLYM